MITFLHQATAQDKARQLDRYFSALSANGRFNGSVWIAENGKIVYEKGFGFADFPAKKPNTVQSSFGIASITKTFVAVCIMQLKEKGKLHLTDPVAKYIPGFPYPNVAIRHLLSHTSGLPDYDELFLATINRYPDTVLTNKELPPAFAAMKIPLAFEPGDSFEYNNVNFNVLALIVEKTSGISFDKYLRQHILEPAGMKNTSLSKAYSRPDKHLVTRFRYQHPWSPALERTDTIAELARVYRNFNFVGAGDLISTATDLLKYDAALYDGRLLSEASLQEAFTPVKLNNGDDNIQRYALGWSVNEDNGFGKCVFHTGGLPGERCMFLRDISGHKTIILFDNTERDTYMFSFNALKILYGGEVPAPKKSAARYYALALAADGISGGGQALAALEKDTAQYDVDEEELNMLGYAFLQDNRDADALEVFRNNVRLFPSSWNVYDSYGEILLKMGNKEEAVRMYKRSIELNSANENGKKVLARLQGQD